MSKFLKWITKERVEIDEIEIFDPSKELKVLLAYSLIFIGLVWTFALVQKAYPLPILNAASFTDDVWYLLFSKFIFLLIVPMLIWKYLGYSIKSLFRFKSSKLTTLRYILISLTFGIFLNQSHLPKIFIELKQIDETQVLSLVLALIIPFFTAALPEELFYRVMLQTRIEKKFGWLISILLSSILFALFHFPSRYVLASGVEGLAGDFTSVMVGTILPSFILGMVFGFLWNRYRNIYLLLALHYGIDVLPSISSHLGISF
ncbi:CPBP family intramembrane glutamic endopeptidase [Peijinzhouia sedimentorum]